MIALIDYGMGNLRSVFNALDMLGAEVKICQNPEELFEAERLILPGVGAFRDCIHNLESRGLVEALNEVVLKQGKPILGICLGMQAMARQSFEMGTYAGLGWFEGDVIRLTPSDPALRVPQVGWNDVQYKPDRVLFAGLPPAPDFYFVHSYYLHCDHDEDVAGVCDYGGPVTASVQKNNIVATQFHPEKSQDYGMRVLENFLRWKP